MATIPAKTQSSSLEQIIAAAVEARLADRLNALESALAELGSKPPGLLDRAGVAELLGTSVATVDRLRRDGLDDIALRVGDVRRWVADDVIAWLRARKGAA